MKNDLFGLSGRIRRWNAYRKTLGELEQLSERELRDVGITRYDIQRIARDSAKMAGL